MTQSQMTPRGHMANLVGRAQPAETPDAGGFCPLMSQTLQLLPVRYGLVEDLDPSIEIAMPYTLQALPLGFRLLRDGFLYIIDSATGFLHEYQIANGSVTALLFKGDQVTKDRRPDVIEADPALAFSRCSVLHVSFSEVQWTAFKCAQVIKVATERDYFMQRVSFENIQRGDARDLIDDRKMAVWLAESSGSWANKPDDNSTKIPYAWEHTPLYRQTIIEEFTSQVTTAHKRDFLFLAVRDDVGVMRDLAQYQDQVVGQIDNWALSQQGEVERDYLLGCYIESLTQINEEDLNKRAKKDRTLKALLDDLETLPDPERTQTRNTLREVMSQDNRQEAGAYFNDPNKPADLQERLEKAKPDRLSMDDGIEARAGTIQQYQLEQRFVGTSPAFIARHRKTLWKLYRQMGKPTEDALYGAKFGQRGINDLIDRPRMDAFLKQQRAILQPLNELLEKITQDRLDLLLKNRLHRAIWYYDIEDSEQVDHALLTEYACLKDICRSDKAVDSVLDWLNNNPAMSRPMFYAAPLSAQTELGVQFAAFTNASWLFFKDAPQWLERLKHWGAGLVLDTGRLSPASQVNLTAAWGTLAPALQMGIQQAVQAFLQQMEKGQLPDMEALFRSLPKAAGVAILDAARRENVTFQVASAEDLQNLGKTVKAVQQHRDRLRTLTSMSRERKAADPSWHRSSDANWFKEQRQTTQRSLAELEQQLAKAMSPVTDLPTDSTHLQSASPGKPGLALVFPAQQHREVQSVLESYRKGVTVAPKAGLLGDGAGLLVFVAQAVNLVVVSREVFSQPNTSRDRWPFFSSLAATMAAGFGAAQGIADTALGAHAAELAKNFKKAELLGVHVQMGKLHIGLGMMGYFAGMIAATMSLASSHKNWQDSVRSGNREAQVGATISMLGNSGFLASNSYGFAQTIQAFRHVLAAEAGTAARTAAWAAAGVRLSTVFLRFNLAGILFTALELSGSWYFNRNNLSRHDRWLLSTPWAQGQDSDLCLSLPLAHYLKELRAHYQAPRMQIIPSSGDTPRRFLLHFPTLFAAELTKPLGSHASATALNIGGYQLLSLIGRPERWSPLGTALEDRLHIKALNPLIVELTDVRGLINSDQPSHTDIVLSIQLGPITSKGQHEANVYEVRFPVFGESGDFPAVDLDPPGEECKYFAIHPDLMPEVKNKMAKDITSPPPINHAPRAGMLEAFQTGQVTYLAPLPLPTDLPAQDYGGAVGELNDRYLDFGVGLPAVFAWQMGLGTPFWAIWFFGLFFPALDWLLSIVEGRGLEKATEFSLQLIRGGLEMGGWAAAFSLTIYLAITFNHLNKYKEVVPTRFNRQRREVCFVPRGHTEPIFVPWESLSAWVVQARSVTQYGMDIRYAMGVGFYHPPHDEHYSLEFFCAGFDLAVCNWEAIRAYMEYEVHTLKEIQDPLELQNPGDPPHEGLHTFYNARERMRRRRKNREVGFFYPFWWYTYHVLTLWTLPNYLTEWEIRRIKSIGRAVVPEAMKSWSEPLPAEQWAKPSGELLRLSQAVKALREKRPGQNLASRFAEVQQAGRNTAKRA